jgi:hypothetical protein
MRSIGLARATAEAEILRLRLMGRRMAKRGVFAAIAALFAVAALLWAHVALGVWMAASLGILQAALILTAGDIVLAGLFALLARSDRPDHAELQARMLRETAWRGLRQELAVAGIMATLTTLFRSRKG